MIKLERINKKKEVKYKDSKRVVISKPLFNIIISLQRELQEKENNKKLGKKKQISFVYASLCLERRLNKK